MLYTNRSLFYKFPLAKKLTPWASVLPFLVLHTGCSNAGVNNISGTGSQESTSQPSISEEISCPLQRLCENLKSGVKNNNGQFVRRQIDYINESDKVSKEKILFWIDNSKNTVLHYLSEHGCASHGFKRLVSDLNKDTIIKLLELYNNNGNNFVDEALANDSFEVYEVYKGILNKFNIDITKIKNRRNDDPILLDLVKKNANIGYSDVVFKKYKPRLGILLNIHYDDMNNIFHEIQQYGVFTNPFRLRTFLALVNNCTPKQLKKYLNEKNSPQNNAGKTSQTPLDILMSSLRHLPQGFNCQERSVYNYTTVEEGIAVLKKELLENLRELQELLKEDDQYIDKEYEKGVDTLIEVMRNSSLQINIDA